MEKYSSLRTRGLILCGPGAFRGSSLHKSLLIPAVVIVMQSIGLYGGGSRRDAVPLSVVGVTFENTDENCRFSVCALVNGVVYAMPFSSSRLGIPVMSCLVCLIKLQTLLLAVCVSPLPSGVTISSRYVQ